MTLKKTSDRQLVALLCSMVTNESKDPAFYVIHKKLGLRKKVESEILRKMRQGQSCK